jgi:hypothetical protein
VRSVCKQPAYVSIRQHTQAACIRQHTSAYAALAPLRRCSQFTGFTSTHSVYLLY